MNKKYIVWVGGIPNYFNTLLDAECEKLEWVDKGYDDIIIEIIDYEKEQQKKVLNNIFDIYNDALLNKIKE